MMSNLKVSEVLRQKSEGQVVQAERWAVQKLGAERAWNRVEVATGLEVW